ncbi:MAG: hypothetical protein H0U18_06095 [Pyrinomonadaceae bacterium]|nr:hypothetical protein [Pyrinomonadaceae bacterium]
MIIWNGLGFLVLVFAFGCSLAMNLITNSLFRDESYYTTRGWPLALALAAAGALTWMVGSALHRRQGKVMIEKETGRESWCCRTTRSSSSDALLGADFSRRRFRIRVLQVRRERRRPVGMSLDQGTASSTPV